MYLHCSLKVSVGGFYTLIFKSKKGDLVCPVLRKWLYFPAPQTAVTPFLIQEEVTGKANDLESSGPKPLTASIWLIVRCEMHEHWGCLPTPESSWWHQSLSAFFPYFFSEAANANGSAGSSQEREDHEYYNEIPGKEPPTGGVLDMRVKAQTDHRANCLLPCKKQYCLVSTSSSGIPICCLLWEWIIKSYCGVRHGINIRTVSWLSWERGF